MKFYLAPNIELEFSEEDSKFIQVVDTTTFKYNNLVYTVQSLDFKIDDIYILMKQLMITNPGKKIFIHHFEQLAHDFFAMFFAIEA